MTKGMAAVRQEWACWKPGEVWHTLQGVWMAHLAAALACDTSWALCSTHRPHRSMCLEETTQLRKCQRGFISLLFLLHPAGVETGKFPFQFHSPFPQDFDNAQ